MNNFYVVEKIGDTNGIYTDAYNEIEDILDELISLNEVKENLILTYGENDRKQAWGLSNSGVNIGKQIWKLGEIDDHYNMKEKYIREIYEDLRMKINENGFCVFRDYKITPIDNWV